MEIETAIRVHLHGIISTIIIEKIYNLDSICVCAVFDRFIFSLSVLIIISFAWLAFWTLINGGHAPLIDIP